MMRTFLSSMRRAPAVLLLVACVAVAVAIWLLPASIHIIGWEDGAPSRLALVPPVEWLLALAGLAVLAVLVLTRLSSDRLDAVLRVTAPLALLWLLALPYLPWLSDHVSAVARTGRTHSMDRRRCRTDRVRPRSSHRSASRDTAAVAAPGSPGGVRRHLRCAARGRGLREVSPGSGWRRAALSGDRSQPDHRR